MGHGEGGRGRDESKASPKEVGVIPADQDLCGVLQLVGESCTFKKRFYGSWSDDLEAGASFRDGLVGGEWFVEGCEGGDEVGELVE